ncbi:MAG: 4-hydroxythreonine-4-phosphate dehydrogenase PdxA [SAR324 cluster bacterium]|nr:4-hydroxythreonine-4-phosphate dehydrogenase PdxA [SAR324 cluster bacterium]
MDPSIQLGLTMGDPNGVGPEIIIRALRQMQPLTWNPLIFGDWHVLQEVNHILENPLLFYKFDEQAPDESAIPVLDLTVSTDREWQPGKLCAWGGESSYCFLTEAIQWALKKKIGAIVTAPLCKEALHAAGHFFPGHTEILSHHTNGSMPVMMLAVDQLRAIHVTLHMSLREAIAALTPERIVKVILIADKALRQMGVEKPRLAVPGLNPHAGENSLFGTEEQEIIIPAIEEAQRLGVDCQGPFPPDIIFLHHRDGLFDAVVTLYHDQAHIPFKLLGFERGVNITLGLPIIRTSVDHGTAFDRAARFQSNPQSLIQAVGFARQMIANDYQFTE